MTLVLFLCVLIRMAMDCWAEWIKQDCWVWHQRSSSRHSGPKTFETKASQFTLTSPWNCDGDLVDPRGCGGGARTLVAPYKTNFRQTFSALGDCRSSTFLLHTNFKL